MRSSFLTKCQPKITRISALPSNKLSGQKFWYFGKPSQNLVGNSDLIYKKLRVEFLKKSIRSVPKSNTAYLAMEYGLQDLDGSTHNMRSISVLLKVYN